MGDTQNDASIDVQTAKDIWLSNQRLSERQRDVVNTVIAQQTTSIRERRLDMIRMQAKVNSIAEEMRSLRDTISRQEVEIELYKAMFAPIRLLPTELLTRIFGFVLPDKVSPRLRSSPLGLTHVCSSWRHAALAFYSLWNNLRVDFRGIKPNIRALMSLIPSWFGRAHPGSPLSLSLWGINPFSPNVVAGILPFFGRISELQIEESSYGYLAAILRYPGACLPKLEYYMSKTKM